MPKEKVMNSREFKKVLNKNGYYLIGTKGDHFKYTNGKNIIIIAKHLNRMIARRLVKENNLKL